MTQSQPDVFKVEILRTGAFTDASGRSVRVDAATLDTLAASYDMTASPAPLVIGHPRDDHPAFGWIKGMKRVGDRLVAFIEQVPGAVRDLVRDGQYRKVSASFYLPGMTGNPKPGGHYLRHVGLLGAAMPAVKGLADVVFAETGDDEPVEIAFSEEAGGAVASATLEPLRLLLERLAGVMTREEIAAIIPDAVRAALDGETEANPTPAAFSEAFDRASDALAGKFARLAQLETAAAALTEERNADFIDGLVGKGVVTPANAPGFRELLNAMEGGEAVAFSEVGYGRDAETMPPAERLRQLLAAQPPFVIFREISAPDSSTLDDDGEDDERISRHMRAAEKEGRRLTPSDAARELGLF